MSILFVGLSVSVITTLPNTFSLYFLLTLSTCVGRAFRSVFDSRPFLACVDLCLSVTFLSVAPIVAASG